MKQLITLSKNAIDACRKIVSINRDKVLKLSLKGGGCNGFEYRFNLSHPKLDKGDENIVIDGVEIQICGKSLMYLLGTEIDWKTDIMGSTFYFNNPNAQSTCGCGTSFSPKE
jgi:iron-sulfur cluster assembly accessory protein